MTQTDSTIETKLRHSIGKLTEVEFLRGGPGDPWHSEDPTAMKEFGWIATHIDAGRDSEFNNWLYVDTDEGMRYYLPEDREIYIGPPRDTLAQVFGANFKVPEEVSPDAITVTAHPLFHDEDLPEPEPDSRPADDPLYRAVMGSAGTGKTFQVRAEAERYDDVLLCATSGIAAVNLGGTTINSLLWYYDLASLRTAYELGRLNAALNKIAGSRYRRIAIDEMSMMDGAQLDILCMALDDVNNQLVKRGDKPIGMTLLGDFLQLPPVGWGEKKSRDGKPLDPVYFCFERPSWARFAENVTMLSKPMRQADPAFIGGLQAVRRGDALAAMEYFQDKLTATDDPKFDGTTILAKNDEVDRYNKLRLLDLNTEEVYFDAQKAGEQLGEWKHIPDRLVVKEGALVMILVNYREDGQLVYANGDMAYFIRAEMHRVLVGTGDNAEFRNERCALVKLRRTGEEVYIPPTTRRKKEATGNAGVKAPRETIKGTIKYTPLRLAWATTTHKAQGLTLESVQLMFGNHFFTHPGMLYVALSRARSMEGLRLVGNITQFVKRCRTNPAVKQWL